MKDFRWGKGEGADNIAALMALAVIAHQTDQKSGIARITYDDFETTTTLSRAKVSRGLKLLNERKIVALEPNGRSTFNLTGFNLPSGWGKFPTKGLYSQGTIAAFRHMHLRVPAELDAIKLYFLFVSRRDNDTNMAKISYDKIEEYSGVNHNNIKRALSFLSVHSLVFPEYFLSSLTEYGMASAYRLAHILPRRHMGTMGRSGSLNENEATAMLRKGLEETPF
ncbi:MAG: hypothetical protein EPO08_11395 [Rhodospirillaceae bacterium]|nr:MAG: hypothetical protein EPO08_11395 [Rhodospirillaceae bacterium]